MSNIAIVGAGPTGSTAAKLLSDAGYSVSIFEEHNTIGLPIQCTGILTKDLFKFVDKSESDRYVINELNEVQVNAPNSSMNIPLTEYVICRKKFDQFLAAKAENAGAKIFTSHKFVGIKNNQLIIKHKNKTIKKPYDLLIGADGPNSIVAKSVCLLKERQFLIGSQAIVKGNFQQNKFRTFFGSTFPNFFGWIVPENKTTARVGYASKGNTRPELSHLIRLTGGKVIQRQAGLIPLYRKQQVQKNNIYLIGDAAGFVKNTTGGGVIPGIWSANILAKAISKNKDYNKVLRPLRKELWIHQILRSTLDNFKDEDYNDLIIMMKDKKVKQLLSSNTREYPSKLLCKLILTKPSFLRFGFRALNV